MKVLNLIHPEKSDLKYEVFTFPDGQPHIKFAPIDRKECGWVTIKCRICNPTDLFILMMAADVLQRQGIVLDRLHIYYLMASRMDRVMSFEEPYTLKIVATFINAIHAREVQLMGSHSWMPRALLYNLFLDMPTKMEELVPQDAVIVFPDKGASNHYGHNFRDRSVITCTKHRNTDTGYIDSYNLDNPTLVTADHPLCVFDDLCDGGRTFALCAKAIREIEPDAKLHIYVTHMVNPKGIETLSQNYDKVFFTNTYKDWQNEELPDNVTVLEVV